MTNKTPSPQHFFRLKGRANWEELNLAELTLNSYDAASYDFEIFGVRYESGWTEELQDAQRKAKEWLLLQGKGPRWS